MGNWSLYGIIIIVGFFFTLFAFILSQINIDNPFSGQETTVLQMILSWISPF